MFILESVMKDEYVVAPLNAMVIRVVEPAEFKKGIVAERRPLSFAIDNVYGESDYDCSAGEVIAFATCLLIVAAFACFVAYGLASFLSTL
jgi:hypothetical protein